MHGKRPALCEVSCSFAPLGNRVSCGPSCSCCPASAGLAGWEPHVPSCTHGVALCNLLWAFCSLLRPTGLLPAHMASSVSSWFKARSLFASFSGFPAQLKWRGKPTGPVCSLTNMHSSPGCPGSDLSARRKDRNLTPSFLSHPHTHS